MNYIFFGTPHFAVIILEALIEAGYLPTLVMTVPDKPKGRSHVLTPPPVKIFAEERGISVLQPTALKNDSIIDAIAALRPDFFIVAAYGKIIPKGILDIPKKGGINIHPSLLPKYRGPSPIQAAILNGDETTGVTIMLMDEEMDHGPILAQRIFKEVEPPVRGSTSRPTAEELSKNLAELGAQLLIETIPKWLAGEITPQEQDHAKATYTKIIMKEDGRIDWRKSAEEIERMARAYAPWPSAWTIMCDTKGRTKRRGMMRVKILKARVLQFLAIAKNRYSFHDNKNKHENKKGDDKNTDKPGTIIKQNSDLLVACGNGFLMVEELRVEGGKPMSGAEFLRGYGANQTLMFGLE